jgi:hypothetical protein
LRALADHATQRVALERRRIYLGRGDAQRLAELERIAAGATGRLHRASAPPVQDRPEPTSSPGG